MSVSAESTANVDERLIIHKSDEAKRRIDEASCKYSTRYSFFPTSHDILLTSCDTVYLGWSFGEFALMYNVRNIW